MSKLNVLWSGYVVALLVALTAGAARATTFATYSSTTAGTLNGVGFTINWGDATQITTTTQNFLDNLAALDNVSGVVWANYYSDTDMTITFASPISNFEFYAGWWRPNAQFGYDTYTFNSAFTVNQAAVGSYTVTGSNLNLSGGNTFQGILRFTNPVSTLTVVGSNGNTSTIGENSFTLAQGASAVPEIDPNSMGSVMALVVGVLGWLERRRLSFA